MIIDEEFYRGLRAKLYSSFKSGASVILYDMGLGYGELMGQNMKKMGVSKLEVINNFMELGKTHGYGVFNTPFLKMILTGLQGEPAVRLEDRLLCDSHRQNREGRVLSHGGYRGGSLPGTSQQKVHLCRGKVSLQGRIPSANSSLNRLLNNQWTS